MSAPSHRKRTSAMRGFPALLARGGFHPQAIHGLWVKSSASCLAPRLRAGLVAADCDARRSQTGGTSKAQSNIKRKLKKAGHTDATSPLFFYIIGCLGWLKFMATHAMLFA